MDAKRLAASEIKQTKFAPAKAKAAQAATWAKGSLARVYQGVANGLRVFGKTSSYDGE